MANERPKGVAALAHTLTGSARGIGAWRVAAAAEAVERAATAPAPVVLTGALERLAAAVTEAQVAEMRLRQAREAQRLAQQELALAQAQVAQRTIRSPLSGVVVEKYLSEGERVEEKPVLKVATIDPLRVEVIVPALYFSKIKPGMSANVKPEVAEGEVRSAKVIVVDKVIDAASNSFRVRLELPNPNYQLPPGLRCKVDFDLAATDSAKPKAQAPTNTRASLAAGPLK
jgi:multidrug efflux pump subunit AcrA (membrane-fusion protein)